MNFALLILGSLIASVHFSTSVNSEAVETCTDEICHIEENCRCSSTRSPLPDGVAPQLISLTSDEAIVSSFYVTYWEPLLSNRTNPDGNPISGTFFVPHEYTDYEKVQKLYLSGFEIATNSISKHVLQDYWRNASLETLIGEFWGQRQIIARFANIPIEEIQGARTPEYQLAGDRSIEAYQQSGIIYDNSWPTYSNNLLFPYTLDYASIQRCTGGNVCPSEAHPGFWIVPITNIKGRNDVECNALGNCGVEGSAEEIGNWLLGEVEKVRTTSRTPLTIVLNSAWFEFTDNSYDGFVYFLDELKKHDDVFLVSQRQVIDWVKNPVTAENFRTATYERSATCEPNNCELRNLEGNLRYMMACVPCPETYPWVDNPFGELNPTSPPPVTTTTTARTTTEDVTTTTESLAPTED